MRNGRAGASSRNGARLALVESLIHKRPMMSRRFALTGLLAVLLALAAQLGLSASVPVTAVAMRSGGIVLCQTGTTHDPAPGHTPNKQPMTCLSCPFCGVSSLAVVLPADAPSTAQLTEWIVVRGAAVPPSRGPPTLAETPQHPRAPPMTA